MLLSDVGLAANATDGQIFVIQGASMANGNTPATAVIAGAATTLGHPVDIAFDGINLYVAEKAHGLLLRFDNILVTPGGNITPAVSVASTAPESVALVLASSVKRP